MDFHEQDESGDYSVDVEIAGVIRKVNELGYPTYQSCQNYGEYLRSFGMEWNHETKRNYAYIEFEELEVARKFLEEVIRRTGVVHLLYHQIAMEGSPEAWELKWRPSTGNWWVWFPSSEIGLLQEVLDA